MFMESLYVPGAARYIHYLLSLSQQALEPVDGVIPVFTMEEAGAQQD